MLNISPVIIGHGGMSGTMSLQSALSAGRKVVDSHPPGTAIKLIYIGCGYGRVAAIWLLSTLFHSIVGIDNSKTAIRDGKRMENFLLEDTNNSYLQNLATIHRDTESIDGFDDSFNCLFSFSQVYSRN